MDALVEYQMKISAVKEALDVYAKRRVDPKVRNRMRKLRQKARSKGKQKRRLVKPIRKEKGRLVLDTSPFTFNKSPEAKKTVMNPVTRKRVKVKSLSGHSDMRAYKIYKKHFERWKTKWKAKYEKVNKGQQQSTKKASLGESLIRLAHADPQYRDAVLALLLSED